MYLTTMQPLSANILIVIHAVNMSVLEQTMEQYIDDFGSYKRLTANCACKCLPHCGNSCPNCDSCTECGCEECRRIEEFKGLN